MLIDKTLDEILHDVPEPQTKADSFWLTYMRDRGFVLEDVRDAAFDKTFAIPRQVFSGHFQLPRGYRYYCSITVPEDTHAVAIDEQGFVLDPSTTAPAEGVCTLEQYIQHNRKTFPIIFISCCYRVRRMPNP
jgi:hypothetical protein